jgi:alkylation response protein AidB-like acyl-CoA dehydrogenase
MGFVIAQERLGPGRIHHCMRWLGMAQRAFEMMCRYATQRELFGSTLARKANIPDWVAECAAEIQAAVFGAAGVTEDHILSHFYRQARLARIYDGPDEVHKMTVARRILARYETPRG